MKLGKIRRIGRDKLIENNIEDPYIKVDVLAKYTFNMSKQDLLLNDDKEIDCKLEEKFFSYISQVILRKASSVYNK